MGWRPGYVRRASRHVRWLTAARSPHRALRFDHVVAERLFGVHQRLIHRSTHRDNPGQIRKRDPIVALHAVDPCWIPRHPEPPSSFILRSWPSGFLGDGPGNSDRQGVVAWQRDDSRDLRMSVDVVTGAVAIEVPPVFLRSASNASSAGLQRHVHIYARTCPSRPQCWGLWRSGSTASSCTQRTMCAPRATTPATCRRRSGSAR